MAATKQLRPHPAVFAPRAARFIAPRQPFMRPTLQRQLPLTRQYASDAMRTAKPKKPFRLLRNTWRVMYGSVLLGGAYIAYSIYETRFPQEQVTPDPSKKTLVVLGMCGPELK